MMKSWINGKQKHLLIWAILLIYLFSANRFYGMLFLKDGKPVQTNAPLPSETKGVTFKLADLQPVRVDGENLYQIRGYAFQAANPQQANQITILLSSAAQNLAFPTQAVVHPNMIESYPGYQKSMDSAEFSMLLSDQVLKPGIYQIGILLGEKGSARQFYVKTGSVIKKTPNTLKYIPAP